MQGDLKSAGYGRHFLRRSDAAAYITERYGFPCSRQWLAKLAVIGGGPVFRKAGRYPVYEPSELDRWAEARIGPPAAVDLRSRSGVTSWVCDTPIPGS